MIGGLGGEARHVDYREAGPQVAENPAPIGAVHTGHLEIGEDQPGVIPVSISSRAASPSSTLTVPVPAAAHLVDLAIEPGIPLGVIVTMSNTMLLVVAWLT